MVRQNQNRSRKRPTRSRRYNREPKYFEGKAARVLNRLRDSGSTCRTCKFRGEKVAKGTWLCDLFSSPGEPTVVFKKDLCVEWHKKEK